MNVAIRKNMYNRGLEFTSVSKSSKSPKSPIISRKKVSQVPKSEYEYSVCKTNTNK